MPFSKSKYLTAVDVIFYMFIILQFFIFIGLLLYKCILSIYKKEINYIFFFNKWTRKRRKKENLNDEAKKNIYVYDLNLNVSNLHVK